MPATVHQVFDLRAEGSFWTARSEIAEDGLPAVRAIIAGDAASEAVLSLVLENPRLRATIAELSDNDVAVAQDRQRAKVFDNVSRLYRKFAAHAAPELPDAGAFDKWWTTIREEIFKRKVLALRLLWLYDIHVDKPYKFGSSLILRPIRKCDIERRPDKMSADRPLQPTALLETIAFIEPHVFGPSAEELEFEVALSVLYGVTLQVVYIEQYLSSFRGLGGTTTSSPSPSLGRGARPLSITSDEQAATVGDVLAEVKKVNRKANVALAMRRYVSALTRRHHDDMLIDFWIALEALFGEEQGELNYRLALRIAMFIEHEPTARRSLFEFAKRSYGLRSEIVHGVMVGPQYDLLNKTDEAVQKSLYKILRSPESYRKSSMESELLGGTEIALAGMTGVP